MTLFVYGHTNNRSGQHLLSHRSTTSHVFHNKHQESSITSFYNLHSCSLCTSGYTQFTSYTSSSSPSSDSRTGIFLRIRIIRFHVVVKTLVFWLFSTPQSTSLFLGRLTLGTKYNWVRFLEIPENSLVFYEGSPKRSVGRFSNI